MQTYRWASQLDALGDPTRRAIVELLAGGPSPVGELAERLPVSRPAVSQHLGVLKAAGLVSDHAAGTRRIYRLTPGGPAELRAYLDRFWGNALASFAEAVAIDAARRALAGHAPGPHDLPDHTTREDLP
ncbi:MAG: ArsR/SmtB family transcription factor [Jiangellaceae bacterium]